MAIEPTKIGSGVGSKNSRSDGISHSYTEHLSASQDDPSPSDSAPSTSGSSTSGSSTSGSSTSGSSTSGSSTSGLVASIPSMRRDSTGQALDILPDISIDCLVFGLDNGRLNVLLAQHRDGIGQGQWALPGGHIGKLEDLDGAASRILQDVTSAENLFLEQLRAFGRADRFPGGRVITVAYYALVRQEDYKVVAGGPASEVRWWDIHDVPHLVYDHSEIFQHGLKSLRHKVRHEPVGFNLLPEKFTLLQLQELYESILDVKLDKPNFRRKMMNMKLLVDCHEKQQNVAHRAAALYRFDEQVYQALREQGFSFEV